MTPSLTNLSYARMVSISLGGSDVFAELLSCMPDRFFSLPSDAQDEVWKAIQASINRGERDCEKLAALAKANAQA